MRQAGARNAVRPHAKFHSWWVRMDSALGRQPCRTYARNRREGQLRSGARKSGVAHSYYSHDNSDDLLFYECMAYTEPKFSHRQIDNAGDALCGVFSTEMDFDLVFYIINNWRSSHSYPLQLIKMTLLKRARKRDKTALIAQRIKRIPAIEVKLRNNTNMKLSKMHDIGGCRAVLSRVRRVENLVRDYERASVKNSRRGGVFVKKYDYITNPKPDGYRGVHLVYKYRSDSPRLQIYNNLRIEIQLRSKYQHAWATAVETVSTFTGQALKSKIGSDDWKRFFALASSAFALLERRPIVPNTPNNPEELLRELRGYTEQITFVEGLQKAAESIENENGHIFLLQLDSQKRKVEITTFFNDELFAAQDAYLNVERSIQGNPAKQAVLVSVENFRFAPQGLSQFFLGY